jgi:hypothetical protein
MDKENNPPSPDAPVVVPPVAVPGPSGRQAASGRHSARNHPTGPITPAGSPPHSDDEDSDSGSAASEESLHTTTGSENDDDEEESDGGQPVRYLIDFLQFNSMFIIMFE